MDRLQVQQVEMEQEKVAELRMDRELRRSQLKFEQLRHMKELESRATEQSLSFGDLALCEEETKRRNDQMDKILEVLLKRQ